MSVSFLASELGKWDQLDKAPEALMLPFFADERPLRGAAGLCDWRLCGRLSRMLHAGRVRGAWGETTLYPPVVEGALRLPFPRLVLFRVLGGGAMVMAVVVSHLDVVPLWGAVAAVSGFMVAAAGRMVPAQAMMLGASVPAVRGSFMSLNTAVQHLATGIAPVLAGAILTHRPDGFPLVGWVSAGTAAVSLVLAGRLKPAPSQHAVVPAAA